MVVVDRRWRRRKGKENVTESASRSSGKRRRRNMAQRSGRR